MLIAAAAYAIARLAASLCRCCFLPLPRCSCSGFRKRYGVRVFSSRCRHEVATVISICRHVTPAAIAATRLMRTLRYIRRDAIAASRMPHTLPSRCVSVDFLFCHAQRCRHIDDAAPDEVTHYHCLICVFFFFAAAKAMMRECRFFR